MYLAQGRCVSEGASGLVMPCTHAYPAGDAATMIHSLVIHIRPFNLSMHVHNLVINMSPGLVGHKTTSQLFQPGYEYIGLVINM